MAEENKIDNLFKSKLNPLEIQPSEKSRIAIEAELERQKVLFYKKRINNYRIATVALGLILISFIAYFNLYQLDSNNSVIDKVEKEVSPAENSNTFENNSGAQSHFKSENNQVAEDEQIKNDERGRTQKKINNIKIDDRVDNLNKYSQAKQYFTLAASVELNEILNVSRETKFGEPLIEQLKLDNDLSENTNINSKVISENTVTETEVISNSTRTPVSVALFYSPHYSYCIFKDNTPENNIDELKMYNDIEDSEFSYSTGFAMRYHFSDHWAFSAGLTYATVVKSVSLLTVYADKNSDNEMYYAYSTSSGIIEIPDRGNTAHVGDSLRLDKEGEKILKYIHIPFMARYSINKNKINWFFNGGPSVNFLIQDKAKIIADNKEEIIYNKTQGLKTTSFGFVVGAGMEYKLTNNLNLLFEPVFKGTFTSITENTSVKNYPYSIGANFGLAIGF